nr:hypothetical protein BgiMline_034336 [Biomphalaria glabrata]
MILTISLAFVFIPSQNRDVILLCPHELETRKQVFNRDKVQTILVKKATVRKYQMYGHLYEDLCRQLNTGLKATP